MRTRAIQITLAILTAVCSSILAVTSFAQEPPLDINRGPDPTNAMIDGRVLLPSGQSANFNVNITLSEMHRPLATLYTNKHAEFRFPNLREGEYFVQAVADEKIYEPVTQRVILTRSQNYQLSITLRKKEEIVKRKSSAQVVSASELDRAAPQEIGRASC